jgi:hypothetical protein
MSNEDRYKILSVRNELQRLLEEISSEMLWKDIKDCVVILDRFLSDNP